MVLAEMASTDTAVFAWNQYFSRLIVAWNPSVEVISGGSEQSMSNLISRLVSMARNNPDYFGSVLTGYFSIVLNIGLQIFLVPFYLRKLGYAEFGILMVLLSFVNFSTVGVYGFASGILRSLGERVVAKDMRAFAQTYSSSRLVVIGYGVALILITFAVLLWSGMGIIGASDEGSGNLSITLFLTALYLLVLFDLSLNRVALTAAGHQMFGNIVQLVQFVSFGASVIPLLLFNAGLGGVIACFLIGAVVARTCAWGYWRHEGLPRIAMFDSSAHFSMKKFFGRSGAAYFLQTAVYFAMQADVLIVGWLGGSKVAATFVLVWKIAEVMIVILGRVSESLLIEFIHMDARGDMERIGRVYRYGISLVRLCSLLAGAGYALLGHWGVSLWVGEDNAPDTQWGYWLAGAAIVWLGSARLPAILAYARVKMRALLLVSGFEFCAKLLLTVLLFPRVSFLAPIIAINVVHIFGMALGYAQLGRRVLLQTS